MINMPDKNEFLKKYYAEITTLIVFAIYILTTAPSVMEIDAGELATVQATLGIAHPTGYPLFTVLGYILLRIPLPFTTIYRANFLAALFCSLGIWLFVKSVKFLLENNVLPAGKVVQSKKKNLKTSSPGSQNEEQPFAILAAVCAGFTLAFNKTIWMQSTSVEVYSLQIFLIGLIIYTVLKTYYKKEEKSYNWIWFGLALALGFSNHMTTLLLLPFAAIFFFMKEKFCRSSVIKIFFSLAAFIPIIILFYSYLPLRASTNPILNWGNPVNFENFFRHVTGKQYQVWLFASVDAAKEHLGQFLQGFPSEFGYAGFVIGLIGIFYSFKTARKIFYPLIITFLFAVLYTINYDIHDLDSYFSTAYIIFSIFIAFGFVRLCLISIRKFRRMDFIILISLVLSLFPLALNYTDVDESKVYTYEDYTKAVLNSANKNAIIFSYQWDYFVSASYYFQYVENVRKDITVMDKELLRRSWYYRQQEKNHPDVMENLQPEISNFLNAVKPFERGENFNSGIIEKCYRTFMTDLVAKNIDKRNFYIGPELVQNEMQRGEFSLPQGYQIIPDLLLFQVVRGNEYVPSKDPDFIIRFPKRRDHYIDFIANITASMLTYRAMYELQYNKIDRARIYIDKVKKDFPEFQIPQQVENRIR